MSYRNDFRPYSIDLFNDFGFKFIKSKSEAVKKQGRFKLIAALLGNEKSVFVSCEVEHKQFVELNKKLTGGRYWGDQLIDVLTNHAFPDNLYKGKEGLYGEIYFKKRYSEIGLSSELAKVEFQRLLTQYILPWFEKHNSMEKIRETFRINAINKKLWDKSWNNTDFSPRSRSKGQAFYQDVIISRLLNDDTRTAKEIYIDIYEKGYEEYWNHIDDDEGVPMRELSNTKPDVDEVPIIIEKLDSISEEQWEVYRKEVL